MNTEKIMAALDYLVPNCNYMIVGDNIDKIVWNDERQQPTKEEILKTISLIEASIDKKNNSKLANEIEESALLYIKKYFNIDSQLYMIIVYIQTLGNKHIPSDENKYNIENMNNIKEIWNWMAEIINYSKKISDKVREGQKINTDDMNWEKLFNKTKPKLKLK